MGVSQIYQSLADLILRRPDQGRLEGCEVGAFGPSFETDAARPPQDEVRSSRPLRWLLLLTLIPILSGCSDRWGWYVVDPTLPSGWLNLQFMFSGLKYTLLLSVTAIAISVVLGLLVALPGLSSNPILRGINRVYVEVVRAPPILVLILWVYYGLPQAADIQITAFWAGVLALAISDSAFEAEIYRSGIQSIDKGQYEAAQTIALGYTDTMRFVILPQAIRRILPAMGNQFVYMLKMSSLVSVIGMEELTRKANELNNAEYRPLEVYSVLVLEYLVLVLIVSALVRWFERRMMAGETR